MSNLNENQEQAVEQAESEGLTVVHSSTTLLLIDLDGAQAIDYFNDSVERVTDALKDRDVTLTELARWKSKSGKGLHIKMKLSKPLNVSTRLLLQACLGSDRLREFLSLMRKWDGCKEPSLLFRPPKKSGVKNPAGRRSNVQVSPGPLRKSRAAYDSILDDDVPY